MDGLEEQLSDTSAGQIVLTRDLQSVAGTVNYSASGWVQVSSAAANVERAHNPLWQLTFCDTGQDFTCVYGMGMNHTGADSGGFDGWQFLVASGNIRGRISMYGYKDS